MFYNHSMITLYALGNPGARYARTKHNAARILLDAIASQYALPVPNAQGVRWNFSDTSCTVVYPDTFMNESVNALPGIVNVIVVHDDHDLPFGTIRISHDRGDGGHNGIRSIIARYGKTFTRIRIGIASSEKGVARDHVLAPFTETELKELQALAPHGYTVIHTLLCDGYEKAMNRYNIKSLS